MATNCALVRNHKGDLALRVGDQFAADVTVSQIGYVEGALTAFLMVPVKSLTFEEQSNVVPMRRKAA